MFYHTVMAQYGYVRLCNETKECYEMQLRDLTLKATLLALILKAKYCVVEANDQLWTNMI